MAEYQKELTKVEEELELVEVELQELLERQSQLLNKRTELKTILSQHEEEAHQKKLDIKWDSEDFPWTKEMDEIIKNVFKIKELRPMQRQTMNATLHKSFCPFNDDSDSDYDEKVTKIESSASSSPHQSILVSDDEDFQT
ncbi:ATP-dependent DNA helicase Q1-like [Physella acuta]|uniref:ATP-dependent DNA helicase Q1-like n=1 Tax=Physella acuta TaxID=109671 RepID=UPI0027DE16E0|nr:ATP-dependent DNA helicase Q1-like [Physella acuta]